MKKFSLTLLMAMLAGSAMANEFTAQAKVIKSDAIYAAGQQQCVDETVKTQGESASGSSGLMGQVIGGVVGGLLGNQVGKGKGKMVATAGGAIAGAVVGGNVATSGSNNGGTQTVRRCTEGAQQVVGYNVSYEYQGQAYTSRMSRAPSGEFIDVRVRQSITPIN